MLMCAYRLYCTSLIAITFLALLLYNSNRQREIHAAQRSALQLYPQISTFLDVFRKRYQISLEQMQKILPDKVVSNLALLMPVFLCLKGTFWKREMPMPGHSLLFK